MSHRVEVDGSFVTTGRFARGVETGWVRVGDSRTFRRVVAGADGRPVVVEGEERAVGDTIQVVETGRRAARAGVRLDQQ